MSREILATAYDSWVASDEYRKQSAMENGSAQREGQEIVKLVESKEVSTVWDYIISAACEAENAAFEQGFRRGILFMTEMLQGGTCHA